ncbi:MAG: hypothetical protein Q7W13_03390 [Bacteroidia bacterium]|nr:hypothetical protein [Bacteroidia bacterium]
MKTFKTTFIAVFLISANLFGQTFNSGFDSKEMENLKKGPLYIVQTGDKIFDDSLKASVEKYWKISPTKTLTKNEYVKYLGDENNCFIAPLNGRTTDVSSPISNKEIDGIYIFYGSARKKSSQLPMAYCPFYFYERAFTGRFLDFTVKYLNDLTNFVIDNKIEEWRYAHATNDRIHLFEKGFPKDPSALKTKTLLVSEICTRPLKKEVLAKYKYSYKVASLTEIVSLINSEPEKYCVISDNTALFTGHILIFDGGSKSAIYADRKAANMSVKEKQIINLNAAIGKK